MKTATLLLAILAFLSAHDLQPSASANSSSGVFWVAQTRPEPGFIERLDAPGFPLQVTSTPLITNTVTSTQELFATQLAEGEEAETPTPLPPLIEVRPREMVRTLLPRLMAALFILAGGWLAATLLRNIVFGLLGKVHPDVRFFMARLIYISVWIIAFLWVLSVFQVQIATLTAIIGVLGLALSLSSQDLIKNLIAGVYLLLERPFGVGDWITVGTHAGRVEFIDLRTTILVTEDGERVIVPNTVMMSQVVVKK